MKTIINYLQAFGINPIKTIRSFGRIRYYLKTYFALKKQSNGLEHEFEIFMSYPCLHDENDNSGVASGHYFHQDLYVATCISARKPDRHIDIGSRVDGFVAHVAAYREIEVFDIRQLKSPHKNIVFNQLDLTKKIKDKYIECTDSLSCLHALEHIGLGRYGDNVDFKGHIKALENLTKMLKPGGVLYLSVPIGSQRIEFNAHRVFSVQYLSSIFKNLNFRVHAVSYINDRGDFFEDVKLSDGMTDNYKCEYGCIILTCKNNIIA
jgi:hypothetical protein